MPARSILGWLRKRRTVAMGVSRFVGGPATNRVRALLGLPPLHPAERPLLRPPSNWRERMVAIAARAVADNEVALDASDQQPTSYVDDRAFETLVTGVAPAPEAFSVAEPPVPAAESDTSAVTAERTVSAGARPPREIPRARVAEPPPAPRQPTARSDARPTSPPLRAQATAAKPESAASAPSVAASARESKPESGRAPETTPVLPSTANPTELARELATAAVPPGFDVADTTSAPVAPRADSAPPTSAPAASTATDATPLRLPAPRPERAHPPQRPESEATRPATPADRVSTERASDSPPLDARLEAAPPPRAIDASMPPATRQPSKETAQESTASDAAPPPLPPTATHASGSARAAEVAGVASTPAEPPSAPGVAPRERMEVPRSDAVAEVQPKLDAPREPVVAAPPNEERRARRPIVTAPPAAAAESAAADASTQSRATSTSPAAEPSEASAPETPAAERSLADWRRLLFEATATPAEPSASAAEHAGAPHASETPPQLDPTSIAARLGAEPLLQSTRQFLRPRVGIDPATVPIVRSAAADRLLDRAGADAAAIGEVIALPTTADERSPQTRALLAHELTHVAQRQRPRFVPPALRARAADAERSGATEQSAFSEERLALDVERVVAGQAATIDQPGGPADAPAYDDAPHPFQPPASLAPRSRPASEWGSLPAPWEPLPYMGDSAGSREAPVAVAPVADAAPVHFAEHGRTLDEPEAAPTPGAHAPAEHAPPPAPDLDTLARKVYDVLKRRLAAERRREG